MALSERKENEIRALADAWAETLTALAEQKSIQRTRSE